MWLIAIVQLTSAALEVSGSSTCPHADDVSARLSEVLPATTPREVRATIEHVEGQLVVEMTDADGVMLGSGALPASAACDELASAAAVMIAAWHARLEAPVPVPRLPSVPQVQAEPPPQPRSGLRLSYEVSAAPVLFSSGAQIAFGGRLSATLGPAASRWAAELGVAAQTSREIAIGTGTGQWQRTALHAGPAWAAVLGGPVRVQLAVCGIGSILSIRGRGFETNRSSSGFEIGLGAFAKITSSALGLRPFATLGGSLWPGSQRLTVAGIEKSATIPAFEFSLALGIAWAAE